MSRKVVILGATGSIGASGLDVVRHLPGQFTVLGLTGGGNVELLAEQAREFKPALVAMATEARAEDLRGSLSDVDTEVLGGPEGVLRVAGMEEADVVLVAISGSQALLPTLEAARRTRVLALASKEPMVMAGHLVIEAVAGNGGTLVPVDSEPNAVFQCLRGREGSGLRRIILTASGGPFHRRRDVDLEKVSSAEALAHPVWRMGRKISVDSATLMNKGLEVIEACALFSLGVDQVDVVVHPQGIVHSLVEFVDGCVLALLGITDMKVPIQYALTFPDRVGTPFRRLDLAEVGHLDFEPPDNKRFPCLDLACAAGREGGSMTTVLNGANEVAVESFLHGRLRFTEIPTVCERVMGEHRPVPRPTLEDVLAIDKWTHERSREVVACLTRS